MRLIDADKIHKAIYASDDNITGDGMTQDEMDAYNDGIYVQYKRIENAPTIDAVPIKWIKEWIDKHETDCNTVEGMLMDWMEVKKVGN